MPEASIGETVSDNLLVERARVGDRDALEELFRRHWGVARRVAFRLLGHEQDAQDVTQECMIKVLSHLKDFDGRSGFRTWLLRIVTNASFDAGRKRKRRPLLGLGASPGDGPGDGGEAGPGPPEPAIDDDPSRDLRRQDLRRALDLALGRLAPNQREAFVLFAEAGLTYEEIAEVQAVPIGTVMSRLYYARSKLQKFLVGFEGL
jgi:RNA polymerase sigma-70 factor (ECF subfamily)